MSTLRLRALIVLALELGLTLNQLRVPNAVEQAKCAVFAKACLAKWSQQVRVVVVVAWAQWLLLHVQSAQAKDAYRRVSPTQSMFLAELIRARQ